MPSRAMMLWGAAICATAGMVLLVVESINVFRGNVLSTTGSALLFVGVGLVVVAGVLTVVGIRVSPGAEVAAIAAADDTDTDTDADADDIANDAPAPATEPAWKFLCRAECAGRVDAGELSSSVRRGATLSAYQEGITIAIGKTEEQRPWAELTAIVAALNPGEAQISVSYDGRHGETAATFTGRNADLAPVATALVSAAPAGLVTVTYG